LLPATHAQFVRAYAEGTIEIGIDRAAAARHVSERLLLPFMLMPLLGLGVGLALVGYLLSGIAVFLGALALRALVRASSRGFVLNRSLQDPAFYEEMVRRQIVVVNERG
jgi:hypothetical protein